MKIDLLKEQLQKIREFNLSKEDILSVLYPVIEEQEVNRFEIFNNKFIIDNHLLEVAPINKKRVLFAINYWSNELKKTHLEMEQARYNYPYKLSVEQEFGYFWDKKNKIKEQIRYFEDILKRYVWSKQNKNEIDIEEIKKIPISDFIDFNKASFANCIWHSEKTPSMKYNSKTNHVYCFGCNKHGSVIDVVMQLEGLSFKNALKRLAS